MARIGIDTRRVIGNTQEMVVAALCDVKPLTVLSKNQLFDEVYKCPDDKISRTLGKAGELIKSYTKSSVNHPDALQLVLSKQEWRNFSQDVLDALDDGADRLIGDSENLKRKVNDYKEIIRILLSPKPRFIEEKRRNDLRAIKSVAKHINMKQAYMLGENSYYGKPDNFDMYVRNSKQTLKEIDHLKKKHDVFSRRGMTEVSHSVKKHIKLLEEVCAEQYLGFHRLNPVDAAMISARMHDIKWHEIHFLNIPFKFFENSYWPEGKKEEEIIKDEMKRSLIMKDRKLAFAESVSFSYQPRLYPVNKFPNTPALVENIIGAIEKFEELDGCPVFDYYWVLVPSININHPYFRHKDGWSVYARKKINSGWSDLELSHFTDEYEAALALDMALVCDGYFVPVVLGERDGKCYFVSLWR